MLRLSKPQARRSDVENEQTTPREPQQSVTLEVHDVVIDADEIFRFCPSGPIAIKED